jgi:heme/copper-type cytochrome/quinol oxidase subunit 2
MTNRTRFALLGLAVAVAIVAIVIAVSSGSDNDNDNDNKSTTVSTVPVQPKPVQIEVKGGKPVGGIKKIKVDKGDRVQFAVHSDVADEVHVHGYDFHKDVAAGGTVRFDFPAKIDGSFEIELEDLEEQIASLQVQP